MKIYNNNEEIARDLKRLKLQRNIKIEELKMIKYQFQEDISPASWLKEVLSIASRFGFYKLMRRIF